MKCSGISTTRPLGLAPNHPRALPCNTTCMPWRQVSAIHVARPISLCHRGALRPALRPARSLGTQTGGTNQLAAVQQEILECKMDLQKLQPGDPERAGVRNQLAALQQKEVLLMQQAQGAAALQRRRRKLVAETEYADPDYNIYVEDSIADAVCDDLIQGAFLLLTAHRQAGKTSLAVAIERAALRANVRVLYLDLALLLRHDDYENLFSTIIRRLGLPCGTGVAGSDCLLDHLQQPAAPKLVLIMDEGDALEEALVDKETGSPARLEQFLKIMRGIKQSFNKKAGCLLVGTDAVTHLIGRFATGNLSKVSPFSLVRHLAPPRFTQDDVAQLVAQLCAEWARDGAESCMETSKIAASVMALTAGHRGLTGQCLYAMEQRLRSGKPLTARWWLDKQSSLMPYVLGSVGNVTYTRIVSDLVKIQHEPAVQEVIDEMMRTGGYHDTGREPAPMLSTGVRVSHKLEWMGLLLPPAADTKAQVSAPLLMSALMVAAAPPVIDPLTVQPPPTHGDSPVDRPTYRHKFQWMLVEALKHISLHFLDFAEARRTTDSQPFEYGVAYALGKAIEGVLLVTPAYAGYQCIPESRPLVPQPAAPNTDSSKNKTSYLDWKIRSGEVFCLELMIMPRNTASAALEEVDRHIDNCVRYVREHGMHPCFLTNVLVVDQYHTAAAASAANAKEAADAAFQAAEADAACARASEDAAAVAEADAKAETMRLAAQRAAAEATSAAKAAKAMASAEELGLTRYLLQGGVPKDLRVGAPVKARIAQDVWRQLSGGAGAPMTAEEEGLLQVMLDAFGPYDQSNMLVDGQDLITVVDVILYRQLGCALVRFTDSWRVMSVPLPAESAARQWAFDFGRFSKARPDGFSATINSLAQEAVAGARAPTGAGHRGKYKKQQQQEQ